jgi:lipopolysaccharide/colanic/teichoic acid biosynthesis glycosyltransferase
VRTKVRYDQEYIRRRSIWEDLRIMLRTIPVILLRRGAWKSRLYTPAEVAASRRS